MVLTEHLFSRLPSSLLMTNWSAIMRTSWWLKVHSWRVNTAMSSSQSEAASKCQCGRKSFHVELGLLLRFFPFQTSLAYGDLQLYIMKFWLHSLLIKPVSRCVDFLNSMTDGSRLTRPNQEAYSWESRCFWKTLLLLPWSKTLSKRWISLFIFLFKSRCILWFLQVKFLELHSLHLWSLK